VGGVPAVDLVEETFVVADPAALAAWVHDRAIWPLLWPGLSLTVAEDRGPAGIRWLVGGALVGSAEIWLAPYGDGTVVHAYLRADPPSTGRGRRPARRAARELHRRQRALKRLLFGVKDQFEAGRAAGVGRSSRPPGLPTSQG